MPFEVHLRCGRLAMRLLDFSHGVIWRIALSRFDLHTRAESLTKSDSTYIRSLKKAAEIAHAKSEVTLGRSTPCAAAELVAGMEALLSGGITKLGLLRLRLELTEWEKSERWATHAAADNARASGPGD